MGISILKVIQFNKTGTINNDDGYYDDSWVRLFLYDSSDRYYHLARIVYQDGSIGKTRYFHIEETSVIELPISELPEKWQEDLWLYLLSE